MTPCRRVTLALLGTAAVLAGCGGEPAPVLDRDAILRLDVSEYRITPQNVRVVATAVPTRLRIVVRNVGRLTHTVKVERIQPDSQAVDEGVAAVPSPVVKGAGVGNVPPGGREIGEPFYLEPGRYKLTDTVGNHENLGAYGELVVDPPPGT
jgi:hypothetical protein